MFLLRHHRVLALALLALAACGGSGDGAAQSSDPAQSIEPATDCPIATSPRVGQADCAPVGPSMDASQGFVRDASGWGYAPILPPATCSGATIAVLGEAACQPIDDCDAPFPPAGASVVLHDGDKLADALAKTPNGGTIALDQGVYEGIVLDRDVHIVGRCASKAIVRAKTPPPTGNETPGAPEKGAAEKAFDFPKDVAFELRSVTVEGFPIGAWADHGKLTLANVVFSGERVALAMSFGSSLTATRTVIEASSTYPRVDAIGIDVLYGPQITLDGVDVRGQDTGISVNSPATKLAMRRSYVHDQHEPVYRGSALEAFRGATATIDESVLTTTAGNALVVGRFISDPGTRDANAGPANVTVTKSVLRHEGGPADAESREGVSVLYDAASATLEDVTVVHESFGAFAVTTGAKLVARRTAFLSGPSEAPTRMALGVYDHGSNATLEDSAIVGAKQVAILVHDKGTNLTLTRSLVTGTASQFLGGFEDIGGTGQALAIGHGAVLEAADSALVANEGLALFALDGVTAHLARTVVDGTRATKEGLLGAGLCLSAASTILVEQSAMRKNADGALAIDQSSGIVSETLLADNGIAVRTSGGTSATEAKDAPLDVTDGTLVLYATRLERNGQKFLDEALSVPAPSGSTQ